MVLQIYKKTFRTLLKWIVIVNWKWLKCDFNARICQSLIRIDHHYMKKYLSTLCYLKTNILVLQTLKKSRFYLSQFNSTRSRLPYFVSLLLFDFLVKFCDKLEILRKIPLSRLAVKSLAKAYDAQVFTWLKFDAQLHWSRFHDKCYWITYMVLSNLHAGAGY